MFYLYLYKGDFLLPEYLIKDKSGARLEFVSLMA